MMTETREYLSAYEECTVPFHRRFNSHAELDAKIVQQLTRRHFSLAVVPNIQAKLDKLVERIRNTWVKKYNFTFANSGALQATSLTWKAPGYDNASARGVKRNAAGDVVRAVDPGNRAPLNAPTGPAGYAQPTFPKRDEFTFPAPRLDTQVQNSQVAANGKVGFQPLLIHENDPRLAAYFSRYKSLDHVYTLDRREKVQRLLVLLPNESVAHCMEALWHCDGDADKAHDRLTKQKDKQVIEISDMDEDDNDSAFERARNTHQIGKPPHQVNSKVLTKTQRTRQNRMNKLLGLGTLQKPSKKAKSNLRNSPDYRPFRNDGLTTEPFAPQPKRSFAQPSAAPDYISLIDDAPASGVRRSKRLKRKAEIDLTTEGDHSLEPANGATGFFSSVTIEPAVRSILSHISANGPIPGSPAINSTRAADDTSQGIVAGQPEKLQAIVSAAHDKCVDAQQDPQHRTQQLTQTDAQQQQHDLQQPTRPNARHTTASLMHSLVSSMRQASVSLQQPSQQEQNQGDRPDTGTKAFAPVDEHPPREKSTTSMREDNGKSELIDKDGTSHHTPMPVIVDGRTPEQRLKEPFPEISGRFSSNPLVPVISLDFIGTGFGAAVHLAKERLTNGTKSADVARKEPANARVVAGAVLSKLSAQLDQSPAPTRETQNIDDQVSELEEGEILEEDAPTADARHVPGAMVVDTSEHQTSGTSSTCAMPVLSDSGQINFSIGALNKSLRESGQFGGAEDRA